MTGLAWFCDAIVEIFEGLAEGVDMATAAIVDAFAEVFS